MRRSFLITVSALGLVVCLLGGTGLFAALTDSATTGTNQVDSAPLAGSANLQLALNDGLTPAMTMTCGAFSDDLATGLVSGTGLIQSVNSAGSVFCLRNVGSQ